MPPLLAPVPFLDALAFASIQSCQISFGFTNMRGILALCMFRQFAPSCSMSCHNPGDLQLASGWKAYRKWPNFCRQPRLRQITEGASSLTCGLMLVDEELRNQSRWLQYYSTFWHQVRGHPLSTYANFSAFLTPSPPCTHFGLNHKTKFTQPRLLRTLFGPLPPSPSLRTYFMDAP